MSAPKHTPGPWIAHPFQHGSDDPRWRVIQLGSSGGSAGLAVVHPRRNAQGKTVEANAHLIAAAPELLKVLRMARAKIAADLQVMVMSHTGPDGLIDDAEVVLLIEAEQDLVNQIDAAIAKAEGAA